MKDWGKKFLIVQKLLKGGEMVGKMVLVTDQHSAIFMINETLGSIQSVYDH